MDRYRNPSILIAVGLTLGAVLGVVIVAPQLPPSIEKSWIETYANLGGSFVTLLTIGALATQIWRTDRNHRQTLDAMFSRELSEWSRTDGSISEFAANVLDDCDMAVELVERMAPAAIGFGKFGYQWLPGKIISFPTYALREIKVPVQPDKIIVGVSGVVTSHFLEMISAAKEANDLSSQKTNDPWLWPPRDPGELFGAINERFAVDGKWATAYMNQIIRARDAAASAVLAAKRTQPARYTEGS